MAKSFLRWAGGKRELLPTLLSNIPSEFNNYIEPFLGGGSMFFGLSPKKGVIADLNAELVNLYQVIQSQPDRLLEEIAKMQFSKEAFYKVRSMDRSPSFHKLAPVVKAARTIYLNKTCFNGLYRVAKRTGFFNSPYGYRSSPTILCKKELAKCNNALKGIEIKHADYSVALATAKKGDFAYLDPPYIPIGKTSNFTAYNQEGFTIDDQDKLLAACHRLTEKGCKWMLSNSYCKASLELYKDYNIQEVLVSRKINSDSKKRGKIKEVLVTNY